MIHFFTKSLDRVFTLVCFLFFSQLSLAATITTTGSGNWSSTVPNAPWPGGTIPAATDDVVIGNGFTLTVDGDFTCNSMTVGKASTLSVNSSTTLTVTTSLLFPNLAASSSSGTLAGSGTINAASLQVGGTVIPTVNQNVTVVSTLNALNISGNLTLTSQRTPTPITSNISFQLQSGTLTVNGTLQAITDPTGGTTTFTMATGVQSGTLVLPNATPILTSGGGTSAFTFTGTNATVNYSGSSQTVQSVNYRNLILSGNGVKTLQVGTRAISGNLILSGPVSTTTVVALSISGNLDIGDNASFTIGAFNLTVAGATNVGGGASGQLSFTSATGSKVFRGLVTIATGALWSNASANSAVGFQGGISLSGTFDSGTGTHSFYVNSQSLFGDFSIPRLTVSGITLTNNNSLSVSTALGGSGALLQATNSTLNIGGTSSITNLSAGSTINQVTYSGAGQIIAGGAYYDLVLAGSGNKTISKITTVSNNLTVFGTANVLLQQNLTVTGNLTFSLGTTFTPGAHTINISGNFINNGATLAMTNSSVVFDGTNLVQLIGGSAPTTFYNLTLAGSVNKTFTNVTTINANFVINNSIAADLGTFTTHKANALTLGSQYVSSGSWGSSSSTAVNVNDTFFSPAIGFVTIPSKTYYSRTSGNWNSSTTWSTVGFTSSVNAGIYPIAGDVVWIGGNYTVTITAEEACQSLVFQQSSNINNLTVNSGNTLTVTGTITIPNATAPGLNTLNVGDGNLSAASIAFTSSGSTSQHVVSINNGKLTVTGNVSTANSLQTSPRITLNGTGLLQLGGSIWSAASGTLTTVAGSTVEYNGGAQTIQSHTYTGDLKLSGSGTKTLLAGMTSIGGSLKLTGTVSTTTVAPLSIGGSLDIGDGTSLTVGAFNFNVIGTTTIGGGTSGQISFASATGTKIFGDLVTVNTNGKWLNASGNSPIILRGGLTNNGTFTAGTGLYNFDTNNQQLTGTISIPNVNVNLITVTNNGSLSVGTSLVGSGAFAQAINSTLDIGGTCSVALLSANASGNTVSYSSAANQTIVTPVSSQYNNLSLSGIGLKQAPGGTLIMLGDLTNNATGVNGSVVGFDPGTGKVQFAGTSSLLGSSTTTFYDLEVASGTLTASAGTIRVGNNMVLNGTYNHNNGTVAFVGSSQSITGSTAPSTIFNSIIINSTSTLTPPSSLTILSALQNDGTFVQGAGAVTFGGLSTSASITGSSKITFYNINVANGSAATDLILENTVGADLQNILNVGSATFDADGASNNRIFTLLSTSDKPTVDASIAAISGGAVNGSVTVKRYMSRIGSPTYDYQVYRDISSPVNTTVWDLQASLPVTGNFTNHSTVMLGGSPDPTVDNSIPGLTSYTESTAGAFNNGWTQFPLIGADSKTTSFTKGQGYTLFIFGSDDPVVTNGNAAWSVTGPIWSGSVSLPVSYTTTSGGTSNDGWNLVGNPYPSTIDWLAAGWTKTKINDAIYVDNYSVDPPVFASYVYNSGTGTYVSTNGGSQYIAMGQGFWVKANGSSPALAISESAKVAGTQTTMFRQKTPTDLIRIALMSSNSGRDETVIYFNDLATAGFDENFDALKLRNRSGAMNLSSLSFENDNYAINALPSSSCGSSVQLEVSDVTSGTYRLLFSDYQTMSSSTSIELTDNYTKSVINVREKSEYIFTVDQANAATYGRDRFTVNIGGKGGLNPLITVVDPFTLQSSYASGNQWYLNGVKLAGATNQTLKPAASGTYTLEVTTGEGCKASVKKEFIVANGNSSLENEVHAYPNPVTKILKVEVDGEATAAGEIYNTLGAKLANMEFSNQGSYQLGAYDFSFATSGVYILRIEQGGKIKFVRVVRE